MTKYRLPARLRRTPKPPVGLELAGMGVAAALGGLIISLLLTPIVSDEARPYVAVLLTCVLIALIRYSPYLFRRAHLAIALRSHRHNELLRGEHANEQ